MTTTARPSRACTPSWNPICRTAVQLTASWNSWFTQATASCRRYKLDAESTTEFILKFVGRDDHGTGSLAQRPNHVGRKARLLPLGLLHHGTVGWPRFDLLHRRPLHRCHPRQKRSTSRARLHDQGQHDDHGQRGNRPKEKLQLLLTECV
jgi:hypothetical protein